MLAPRVNPMIRYVAYYFFAFAGFFALRNTGGHLEA